MPDYQTPGVYVLDDQFGPRIIPNETAVPAFIGFTEKMLHPNGKPVGLIKDSKSVREPILISTKEEYEKCFGTADTTGTFAVSKNNSNQLEVTVERENKGKKADYTPGFMYPGIKAYFQNGGTACYIISLGTYEDFDSSNPALVNTEDIQKAIKEAVAATLIVPSDLIRYGSASYYKWITELTNFCAGEKRFFCIADVIQQDPQSSNFDSSDIQSYRKEVNPDDQSYVAAYFPYLKSLTPYAYDEARVTYQGNQLAKADQKEITAIKTFLASNFIHLPPSYHMAGIYCKVDSSDCVWNAPANVEILGIEEPVVLITDTQQEGITIDAINGKSINAIRKFYGQGNLPWGARTNAGNSGEWKYIPVRRLAIALETDINQGLEHFVYNPNVHNTWIDIKTMIESYLAGLYQQGALMGSTPDQAYQVRIGQGITMTNQDILDGYLKLDVLFAPRHPAEFIILQFRLQIAQ